MQQYREKFAGSQADRRARDEAANLTDQLNKTKLSGSLLLFSKCCFTFCKLLIGRDPELTTIT